MTLAPQKIPAADYSDFGKIRVTGKDAVSVLHNILTNDIEKLVPGQHCPAALLTHTGKILFYAEIFRFEDHFIITVENQAAAPEIAWLDKFIITEEVQLEEVTAAYCFFQTFTSNPARLLCGKNQADDFIKKQDLRILPFAEAEVLRIEGGIPRYGIDMDENTILSETGLDNIAVSETKGCYPGQEVVARIKTYKGLTKKLSQFEIEGDQIPQAGDKIFTAGTQARIGWVTSAAQSAQTHKITALGYLLKGWFHQIQEVKIITKAGSDLTGKSRLLVF